MLGRLKDYRYSSLLPRTRPPRWLIGLGCFTLFFTIWGFSSHGQKHLNKIPYYFNQQLEHHDLVNVDPDQPPSWEKLRAFEDNLPQHNLDLPFPEGKTGRYVLFRNQIQGLGWNNQLNEILMNTWLAYKSNRAYVFQDLVWNPSHYPWPASKYGGGQPHTPLNALLSGPPAGGSWGPSDPAPRAISQRWFDTVCPENERRKLNTHEVKPPIAWEQGDLIFNTWEKVLTEAPERCIEVIPSDDDKFPQTFDLWLWGGDRILPLWEGFKNSPVSQLLKTSPLVQSAVDLNEYIFRPRGPRPPVPVSMDPYDRMLALHLRRGDYKGACQGFSDWNSTFYSWDQLSFLPDKFIHPDGYTWGKSTPEGHEVYMQRCFPDEAQILEKVKRSRDEYVRAAKPGEHRYLDVIFLLSNDKTGFVDDLKKAFEKDGWSTIVTTRDLDLDAQQKEVGMAVDMDLARKAAVFIGNGWSSFTSNIVHRRLVDGKEPISTRFF